MLYDSYYNKIEKVVRFFRKVFKNIVPICVITGVIIASTIACLLAMGSFVNGVECPDTMVYGDTVDYAANAFLSDVQYEYKLEGSNEWTTTPPTEPGKYSVRAVSTNVFGSKKYSEEKSFVLNKKKIDVSVNESSVIYGGSLSVSANLVNGDTVQCSKFVFDSATDAQTGVRADDKYVVILNKDGKDVTASYDINTPTSEITIEKRQINLSISDKEQVYNGIPLKFGGYEQDENTPLAEGDRIIVNFDINQQTEVGKLPNVPELHIINDQNVDVTTHYNLNTSWGNLTVTARPIGITVLGSSFVYDGDEHKFAEEGKGFVIDDETKAFLESLGHKIVVDNSVGVTNVGNKIKNEIIFNVVDVNDTNKSVTHNYAIVNITNEHSYLEVVPRKLTLNLTDMDKVYDGIDLDREYQIVVYGNDGVAQTEQPVVLKAGVSSVTYKIPFVNDQTLRFDVVGRKSNVQLLGQENDTYKIENIKITDADGNNISASNYDFSESDMEATLKIYPKAIVVTAGDKKVTYNGAPNFCDILTADGILQGHSVATGQGYIFSKITNITDDDVKDNNIVDKDNVVIFDADGNDITFNYVIEKTVPGTITVDARVLHIKSHTATKIYDLTVLEGKFLDNELKSIEAALNGGSNAKAENLCQDEKCGCYCYSDSALAIDINHTIVIKNDSKVIDSTEQYDEENDKYYGLEKNNVFSVQILDENGQDVTSNYDLDLVFGNINVLPNRIILTANDAKKQYDGTPLGDRTGFGIITAEKYGDEYNDLPEYYAVEALEMDGTACDVKDSGAENSIKEYRIVDTRLTEDDEGYDVTENYIVMELKPGKLYIDPREVKIQLISREIIYNGSELKRLFTVLNPVFNEKTGEYDDVLDDHYVQDGNKGTFTIGDLNFTVTFDGENIKNVTDNGAWSTSPSNVEVTYSNGDPANDTANFTVVFVDANGNKTQTPSAVNTITPRPITITLTDEEKVYDATPLDRTYSIVIDGNTEKFSETINNGDVTNGFEHIIECTQNQTMSFILSGTRTNVNVIKDDATDVDKYSIEDIAFSYAEGGEVDSRNYAITIKVIGTDGKEKSGVDEATLTVTPRPIWIATDSNSKYYDGVTLVDKDFDADSDQYVEPETVGRGLLRNDFKHNVTVEFTKSPINVKDSCKNEIILEVFDGEGNNITMNYQLDTSKFGNLTVNRRKVQVQITDVSKVYDGIALDRKYQIKEYNADETIADNFLKVDKADRVITVEYQFANVASEKLIVIITGTRTNFDIEKLGGDSTYGVQYQVVNRDGTTNALWTDNYDFTGSVLEAELNMSARPFYVETGTAEKIYDGAQLIKDDIGNVEPEGKDRGILSGIGQSISLDFNKPTEAGTYENSVVPTIIGGDGTTNVTSNYVMEERFGTLTIHKRKVQVYVEDNQKMYDGTAIDRKYKLDIFGEDNEVIDTTGWITVDHNGSNRQNYTIAAVSNQLFSFTLNGSMTNYSANGGSYYVSFTEVTQSGESVDQNNYEFIGFDSTNRASLVIERRPIKIELNDNTKVYDGLNIDRFYKITVEDDDEESIVTNWITVGHSDSSSITFSVPFVINGQELTFTLNGELKNKGTAEYTAGGMRVFDNFGDVSDNYIISSTPANLEVTARTIYIKLLEQEMTYTGQILDRLYEIFTLDTEGNEYSSGIQAVSGSGNRAKCMIPGVDGEYIEFVVLGKRINVIPGDDESEKYEFKSYSITGNDVDRNNYILDDSKAVSSVNVTVKPKEIIVITKDHSFTYNGKDQSLGLDYTADITVEGLCNGDTYRIISRASIKNVMAYDGLGNIVSNEVENAVELEFITELGEPVDVNNYNIDKSIWIFGTLTVKPITVTVTSGSKTIEYDGTAARSESYTVKYDQTILSDNGALFNGDSVTVVFVMDEKDYPINITADPVKNIIEASVVISETVTDEQERMLLTYNYDIITINGDLRVNKAEWNFYPRVEYSGGKVTDLRYYGEIVVPNTFIIKNSLNVDITNTVLNNHTVEISYSGSADRPMSFNAGITYLRITNKNGTVICDWTPIDENDNQKETPDQNTDIVLNTQNIYVRGDMYLSLGYYTWLFSGEYQFNSSANQNNVGVVSQAGGYKVLGRQIINGTAYYICDNPYTEDENDIMVVTFTYTGHTNIAEFTIGTIKYSDLNNSKYLGWSDNLSLTVRYFDSVEDFNSDPNSGANYGACFDAFYCDANGNTQADFLTVSKRSITVKPKDITVKYNPEKHDNELYQSNKIGDDLYDSAEITYFVSNAGENDTFKKSLIFKYETVQQKISYVEGQNNQYTNSIAIDEETGAYKLEIWYNGVNVTDCFDIVVQAGSISVTK